MNEDPMYELATDYFKENNIMAYNNEDDLHTLLDSLKDGEHVKATWDVDQIEATAEGPVSKADLYCSCFQIIRWGDGDIYPGLTSLEVVRDEEVTVTRDDEEALNALLDSLEDGEVITAEWRNSGGSMTLTGEVQTTGSFQEVWGYSTGVLRWSDAHANDLLHSVTVRRPVVKRWECGGKER